MTTKFYVLEIKNCTSILKEFDRPNDRKKYVDSYKTKYKDYIKDDDNWIELIFDGIVKYKPEDLKVEQK